jgi:hypothetical protein
VLLPGYEIAAGATPGVTAATECQANSYHAGEAAIGADGVQCTPCGNNM